MADWIINEINTNQFFTGGIGVSIFALVLYILRNIPKQIWNLINVHCIYTVRVNNDDQEVYKFVSDWALQKLKHKTKRIKLTRGEGIYRETLNYGHHFLFQKSGVLIVSAEEEKAENVIMRKESITLKFITFNKSLFEELFNYCREQYRLLENKNKIYYNTWGDFYKLSKENQRSINSVFINEELKSLLTEDLQKFYSQKQKYLNLGLNYKRGYLFYGEAGTGKSSFIKALANHFGRNLYYINLDEVEDTNHFKHLVRTIGQNSFIVFEDIDCFQETKSRELPKPNTPDPIKKGLTLSSVLSFLDGDTIPDGCCLFATTNYYSKLDKALIREGRFDVKHEFKKADKSVAYSMAEHFGINNLAFLENIEYPVEQSKLQNIFLQQL